jgi:hypothetical protein
VHRLSDLGAVVTHVVNGSSREGFDAEWREISISTMEGDLISRCEMFDETDLDAALARFEELQRLTPRPENAASRAWERFQACLAAEDWAAMAAMVAEDIVTDDRRRVVGAGVQLGRDVNLANIRATLDIGIENVTLTTIAIRGERVVLDRVRFSPRDQASEPFHSEILRVLEIDAEQRLAAAILFDPDDTDAALAELDARYLAGEAAAHAHTWSVITGAYVSLNRREMPATTADFVDIDHRPLAIAAGDLKAYLATALSDDKHASLLESVHRLSDLGAVVTHSASGTSPEGFNAEWRMTNILTVEGGLLSRCEIFDEADIDTALARFDELHPPAPRLENAATRVYERFHNYFKARDWNAIADILVDDYSQHDRRPIVGGEIRRGGDALLEDLQTAADLDITNAMSHAIGTRGERLVLTLAQYSRSDEDRDAFGVDLLQVAEIDADERITALVAFDPDDADAAFAELDARYLAGEAAAYARTWSVIAGAYAAINRHELPATSPDWVNIDHRRGIAFAPGDATAYLRASQDPQGSVHVETVHRLSKLGAVFTWAGHGTSQDGFEAEWRGINVVTVEGDLITRGEIFDEADIDAALTRFEELQPQPPRLANAASQLIERFRADFAARNWDAIAENSADEIFTEDRRSVVGSGILGGRDLDIANMRAAAELGSANFASTVIATRGERLVLFQLRMSGRDQRPEAFHSDMLGIVEIDADNRVTARLLFDLDDIDAAFEELDARYLAGEAAAHAHVWSLNSTLYAAFNRHEFPATTPDWIYLDHRPLVTIDDLTASLGAIWEQLPDVRIYVEAVHRLTDLGAVVTAAAHGSSREGFDAEWRMIDLFTVEGDLINRCEIFVEADLDAALARFDELAESSRSSQDDAAL